MKYTYSLWCHRTKCEDFTLCSSQLAGQVPLRETAHVVNDPFNHMAITRSMCRFGKLLDRSHPLMHGIHMVCMLIAVNMETEYGVSSGGGGGTCKSLHISVTPKRVGTQCSYTYGLQYSRCNGKLNQK